MIYTNPIPIKDGLWNICPDNKVHLLGSQCKRCGEIFFPSKGNGICSFCQNTDMSPIELSTEGKITSYTVVYRSPTGGFYKGSTPYAYGFVELPERIRIETLFTGCDLEQIRVGMTAGLVIEKLGEDEEGREIHTYKFRPVTQE